jgi:threonine/homoserine/homoserine lactone efflux protein
MGGILLAALLPASFAARPPVLAVRRVSAGAAPRRAAGPQVRAPSWASPTMRPVLLPSPLLADAGSVSADAALLFFQGILVGFAVTAPPGPVGGLAMERTLRLGLRQGLSTALGALLADVFYATIAAFGLASVAAPSGIWREVIAVVVAILLAGLGVTYLRRAWKGTTPAAAETKPRGSGLAGLVAGTFVLTLGTPGTLPAFVAMFASLGLAAKSAETPGGPFLVVLGVVAGAAAWWAALCGVVHRLRDRAHGWLRGMEYACGALLLLGAAGAVWTGFSA